MDTGRFGKLHFKLFLAIAGAIGALTIATYFVFSASFERGFIQYLYRADETRLDWMVEQLAQGYARERSWAWIANDRDRWIAMSRQALGLPPPADAPSAGGADSRAAARDTPLTIDPRL